MNLRFFVAVFLGTMAFTVLGAPAKTTVQVDRTGHAVRPALRGIFFEDINLSADGGIHPESACHRCFEDAEQLESWKLVNASGGQE